MSVTAPVPAFLLQQTPAGIQQLLASAFNARTKKPVNTGAGSSMGAVFNAMVALNIEMQTQIAYAANLTRLQSTAANNPNGVNPDVDSFCYVFIGARDPASASLGQVVFYTNSPAMSPLPIYAQGSVSQPDGTYVQRPDGTQYIVIADTTQSGYDPTTGAYIIQVGATQVIATVQAVAAGSGGNASAGTITQILSITNAPAPPGVSNVTNPLAFDNGFDTETDAAYIARFQAEMSSRWATPLAVSASVDSVQTGLTWQIGDMLDPFGNSVPNSFSVIVNVLGQSVAPDSAVLTAVQTTVQNNRPVGMPYVVQGPTLLSIAASGTLSISPGADPSTVIQNASAALSDYINGLGMVDGVITTPSTANVTVQYTELIAVIRAVAGVANLTGFTINGATADITAGYGVQAVAGNITLQAA